MMPNAKNSCLSDGGLPSSEPCADTPTTSMKKRNLVWLMTVPVLSTAHLPGPDAMQELMAVRTLSDRLLPYPEGWFVFMPVARFDERDAHLPKWFLTILDWFAEHYSDEFWMRFDVDGDEIDGLPTYDW